MKKLLAKKKTPHLDYYKRCMISGKLNDHNSIFDCSGLCEAADNKLIMKKYLNIVEPTIENIRDLRGEGKSSTYWGSDSYLYKTEEFTELRQTIILLMAALNNEL